MILAIRGHAQQLIPAVTLMVADEAKLFMMNGL